MAQNLALVADIGGTNCRLALADGAVLRAGSVSRFRNADHADFETIARAYLSDQHAAPEAVCVAVAGPVRDGAAQMTNLGWRFDQSSLRACTGAQQVQILNDLQAQGYALPHLPSSALTKISGRPDPRGAQTQLMVGLGTGFNVAPVYATAHGPFVAPSESGHIALPCPRDIDPDLIRALADDTGFTAVEELLSGRGLPAVYRWLSAQTGAARDLDSHAILAAQDDPLAVQSIALMVRGLGALLGDFALQFLPFGGVHLVGGMSRALAPHLAQPGFQAAMTDKGRFADLVRDCPVSVIEDDFAALTGCAVMATHAPVAHPPLT